MNDQDSAKVTSTPATTSANGQSSRTVPRAIGDSASRAIGVVGQHPYFTAGIVTGIGIAVGAGLLLRARRRRSFFENLMSRF
jgi:ElaB/YqjD/DUF883 family membrane-anchored ribosome-binding protein